MKKMIITVLLLAWASVVSAGLEITVSDTTAAPGETLSLGVSGDAMTGHTPKRIQGAWLLVNGPAAIENRGFVIYRVPSFRYYDCEELPYYFPWMYDGSCAEALLHFFADDLAFVSLDWGDVAPVNAALVRNITFTCLAEGDVTLSLVDMFDGTLYDTLVVHQVPRQPRLYHVDTAGGSNSNDGLSRETAFATIQKGIDAADDEDTVLVWPGLYNEAINFKGKAITLKSAADAAVIEATGADAVTFHAGEGPGSILKNFVIQNSGLAVSLNYGSAPTISNLTIVNNDFGIAAYENSNPDISNCIFADNRDGDLFGCTAQYSCIAAEGGDEPIEGLVSRWRFDEGAGSIAFDSAGDNHGAIHGAAWTAGMLGGALTFDGVSDYVALPGNAFDDLGPNVTFSAWIYRNSNNPSGQNAVFAYGCSMYDDWFLYFGVTYETVAYHVRKRSSGDDCCYLGSTHIGEHQWYHVVVTTDGEQARAYIDGQPETFTKQPSSESPGTYGFPEISSRADLPRIGVFSRESGNWFYFDGKIDDMRIYSRTLSDLEIEQLYSGQLAKPVARWEFDEGAGNIAFDSVGSNHGIIHGAQWTAGKVDGALDFDAVGDYVRVSDPTSLDLDTHYTVSAWIKTDTVSSSNAIIAAYRDRVTPSVLFQLDRYGSTVRFVVVDESANSQAAVYPYVLSTNSWYHVAGVREGDSLKVFVNGMKGPTAYKAFGQIIPSLVTIGAIDCCALGVHHYFRGSIDEVVVFDKALSVEEIQQLYEGGSGGPGPAFDPLFADAKGGDYHLKSEHGRYWPEHDIWVLDEVTSPCIDAGDPADDCSAEPAPNGGRINAGAYGGTAFAGRSKWRPDGDVNHDGIVNMLDFAIVADNWLTGAGPTPPPDDNVPPAPNPMTWASPPGALSTTTIGMTATTASDESGIQYYFECISGGGHNSNWRDEPIYIDSGLEPNTEYCYRVKARDKSPNQNDTSWSVAACATTPLDTTPPKPDPARWGTTDANGFDGRPREIFVGPDPTFGYAVTMRAQPATDASGQVEYSFDCITDDGFSSSWQQSPAYTVLVGRQGQALTFRVSAHDPYGNHTGWSPALRAVEHFQAYDPIPEDGAVNVIKFDNFGLLSWKAADNVAWHRVYFGANPTPGPSEFCSRQPVGTTSYAPDMSPVTTRQPDTTYYWRIDEEDALAYMTTGKVWSFTTAPAAAHSPDPADKAANVPTDADLAWEPGFSAASHDVYFGTDATAVANADEFSNEFKGNQGSTGFEPGTLASGASYYWRIDQKNTDATVTKGSVWSFTVVD